MDDPISRADLAALLEELAGYHMPYGRYGPKSFPPDGMPIYELPAEYLHYFKVKGWPRGRLGELLEIVYQAKIDGADIMFEPLRAPSGGRRSLRKPRQREFRMGE